MTAYYNENDPYAAAWLRELIKAKLIAQGDVETPNASDHKVGKMGHQGKALVKDALLTDSGQTPNGSTAETVSGGQLNPAFPHWLQGLPPEWCDCAVTATACARQSHKHSSKRLLKQG